MHNSATPNVHNRVIASAFALLHRIPSVVPSTMLQSFSVAINSLPFIVKPLVALLFLLNIRSWPLVWHLRAIRIIFAIRARYALLKLKIMFKSPREKLIAEEDWLDSISPLGQNPMEMVVAYKTRASIDDCDFYGQLSNSSYAKICDSVRFKAVIEMFPRVFAPGGWVALAGTHFHFIHEIPILSPYEVRFSITVWDQKWIFIICKFVTKPKGNKLEQAETPESHAESENSRQGASNLFHASLHTPDICGSPTSEVSTEKLKAIADGFIGKEEPDGAIVNAIAVSHYCFKIGRITVPPALVMATNGFSAPPTSVDATAYSHANPPPHWKTAQVLMSKSHGGGAKKIAQFMKGEWRDVPESERWWEEALGGVVEEQRKANLGIFNALRKGMDAARNA